MKIVANDMRAYVCSAPLCARLKQTQGLLPVHLPSMQDKMNDNKLLTISDCPGQHREYAV